MTSFFQEPGSGRIFTLSSSIIHILKQCVGAEAWTNP